MFPCLFHCLVVQIRLTDGGTLVHTFNATDSLVDVNQYILMNQSGENSPYSLMTTFPRRVFTHHDHNKSLNELGELYQYCYELIDIFLFCRFGTVSCCCSNKRHLNTFSIIILCHCVWQPLYLSFVEISIIIINESN